MRDTVDKTLPGRLSAQEAADRLGYEYTSFLRLARQGKINRAGFWSGYHFPDDLAVEDVDSAYAAGVARAKERTAEHEEGK